MLRNAALCAPRFAFSVKINKVKSLRTVWTVWIQNFSQLEKKKDLQKREQTVEGPSGPLVPLLHSLTFRLFSSSSSSNLTDVTGCVLPNPEVCVSGNGARFLPPGGTNCKRSDPCCPLRAGFQTEGPGTFRGPICEGSQQNGKQFKCNPADRHQSQAPNSVCADLIDGTKVPHSICGGEGD